MLRHTMTIGHIAAIPIRIHWSWPVVLVIIIAALSPIYAAYTGGTGAWLAATIVTLLLCLSIVLHELGHALVARRLRCPVRGITLFALGGVTEIEGERRDPLQELLVAVAGPAVSLLLAITSGLVWWRSPEFVPGLIALHMALTNGMMAAFNLLPGYPMDGGRVLQAVLWFLTDEELPAARIASRVGRACGWLLVLLGVLFAFATGDLIGSGWIGIVGYFLSRGAATGYRRLVLQRILSNVSAADLMQRTYRAVAPDLLLNQFVGRYVLGQSDQGFPVLRYPDADTPQPLLGMMTLRNLRRFALSEWGHTRVGEAMTPAHRVRAIAPETAASEALRVLLESGEEQLPVIGGDALVGILRRRDLLLYVQMRMAGTR